VESFELPFSALSSFSCSNELLSPQLLCFSVDWVDDFDRFSLLRTAFDNALLFLKLLKRGFLSCTGET
jgi:hypothetical protein